MPPFDIKIILHFRTLFYLELRPALEKWWEEWEGNPFPYYQVYRCGIKACVSKTISNDIILCCLGLSYFSHIIWMEKNEVLLTDSQLRGLCLKNPTEKLDKGAWNISFDVVSEGVATLLKNKMCIIWNLHPLYLSFFFHINNPELQFMQILLVILI